MNRQDLEKLLGGYSARILTPDEERALFEAALEDQALFDKLAREQPLRDLLGDPAARAALLAALADNPLPWYRKVAAWATPGRTVLALAAVLCVALPWTLWEARHRNQAPVLTARVSTPAPVQPLRREIVPEAAPHPPAPKARADARQRPEMKALAEPRAFKAAPPLEMPLAANKLADKAEITAGATGAVGGFPQTLGQLNAPKPAAEASSQVAPAPAPVAAPLAKQVQDAARDVVSAPVTPLQWNLLRRQPGGEFTRADGGDLVAGEELKLRLESKSAGYIYVVENQKVLAFSAVAAGKPFDAMLGSQGPGKRNLELWFSLHPMTWAGGDKGGMFRTATQSGAAKKLQTAEAMHAPAGGGGGSAPPPISITITLNYH